MNEACGQDQQQVVVTTMEVGGAQGHPVEVIEGDLLLVYQAFRWKRIRDCPGRYTCRDHDRVASLTPEQLVEGVANVIVRPSTTLTLPGRSDRFFILPLDKSFETGIISYEKASERRYVHTLNTPAGFRRKLEAVGIGISDDGFSVMAEKG